MQFIPDDQTKQSQIPHLDELRSEDGWQGQSSREPIETLRAQIEGEISRLGGSVTSFLRGEYEIDEQRRPGAVIEYQVIAPNGKAFRGRIDVAGPPVKDPYGGNRSHANYKATLASNKEQSLRVALYNAREALKANRILQQLSPGFAALMPWLLAPDGRTFGEAWRGGAKALPAPQADGDIVDAEFQEAD